MPIGTKVIESSMRALVFDGDLKLRDVPRPTPAPGEVLIRPHLVGLCATDLELTRGYKAFRGVIGHEFVGTVVHCADAAWIGRRVVGEINVRCASCAPCQRGDHEHCAERTVLGIQDRAGALAEYVTLPIANLHVVPETLPDQIAVFAEPLAAALEIVQQTHVRPTDQVAVVGDGKLGLLVAQVLRLSGGAVQVIGRHPERWALLDRQRIAATSDPLQLAERSFDLVVDCTGNAGGFAIARRLVRPRGRLVLKSTFHGAIELDLASLIVDEIQLIGSRCGPFAAALRVLERGLVETEPLISAHYPLEQAEQAFAAVPGALKVLVQIADPLQMRS